LSFIDAVSVTQGSLAFFELSLVLGRGQLEPQAWHSLRPL